MNPANYLGGPGPTNVVQQSPSNISPDHRQAIQIVSTVVNGFKTENLALRNENHQLRSRIQELEHTCKERETTNAQLYEDNVLLSNRLNLVSAHSGNAQTPALLNNIKELQERIRNMARTEQSLIDERKRLISLLDVPGANRISVFWDEFQKLCIGYNQVHADMCQFKELVDEGVRRGVIRHRPTVQNPIQLVHQAPSPQVLPPGSPSHSNSFQGYTPPTNILLHMQQQRVANVSDPNQISQSARPNLHLSTQIPPANAHASPTDPRLLQRLNVPNIPNQQFSSHAVPTRMLPTPDLPGHIPQYVRTQQPQQNPPHDFTSLPQNSPPEEKFIAPPTPPLSHQSKSVTPESSMSSVNVKQSDSPIPTVPSPIRGLHQNHTSRKVSVGQKRSSLSLEPYENESPKRPRLSLEGRDVLVDSACQSLTEIVRAEDHEVVPHEVKAQSVLESQPTAELQTTASEPVIPISRDTQEAVMSAQSVLQSQPTVELQTTASEPVIPISGDTQEAAVSAGQGAERGGTGHQEQDPDVDDEPQRGPDGLYKESDVIDWLLVGTAEDEEYGDDGVKICVLCRERVRNNQKVPQYQFLNPSDDELLAHFRTHHNTAFTSARKEGPEYVP